ncbi:Metallo-beta-lactamase domain-containing protein [Tumidithrix helvetica PCC 7403]|uniref:ComEC/Rec2 family competence protein n=1 Tax=Tumidithrix helvetica TaxID=3457545 RepID=UPI003CA043B1
MTCEIVFLPVGNADCIIVHAEDALVVVDLGKNSRFIYKWLEQRQFKKINRIYVTHNHKDHFPFKSIIDLVKFLKLWFSNNGEIEIFSLPYGFYDHANEQLNIQRGHDPNYKELEQALINVFEWDRSRKVRFVEALSDPTPYPIHNLQIYTIHPRSPFIAQQKSKNKINEISLVLRIVYGEFIAIFLADLEGAGLADYLSVVKASAEATKEAKANIVKIPHHGGYPSNGDDLKELLALIDAELAVLSVGSTNRYGHVEPELFKALIELKGNKDNRLDGFICTEVTRTCVHSASDRSAMGKSGLSLSEASKCAGEITIIAETSGKWKLKTETNHSSQVASFPYAACDGRANEPCTALKEIECY